jgi:transcriptional regulator with XRE-family HTH domain
MTLTYDSLIGWQVHTAAGAVPIDDFAKRERLRRGLSCNQLEILAGVSQGYYAHVESGQSHKLEVVLKALAALGFKINITGSPTAPKESGYAAKRATSLR